MTAVMYQVTGLTCNFVYCMCLQPTGIIQTHITFYFSTCDPRTSRPNNLCHKNVGRPWFTETRIILYQPFVLVHNARFHSECYTNDKGSKQTCENAIIPSTNIQHLKIHIRNWIRSQASQWQTEWNEHEVTNCNQMQYVRYTTTTQAR